MASTHDAHPDSPPVGPSADPERVSPDAEPRRESVEDTAGDPAGTAGTGGENKVQDSSFER